MVQNEKNRCENMVICVKILLRDIHFSVRFVGNEVSSFAMHIKGVRQEVT